MHHYTKIYNPSYKFYSILLSETKNVYPGKDACLLLSVTMAAHQHRACVPVAYCMKVKCGGSRLEVLESFHSVVERAFSKKLHLTCP